jgi:hypothetical protein
MPQPISCCPFQILDLSNGFGPQPDAFFHFLGGQFVAPTRFVGDAQGIAGETR